MANNNIEAFLEGILAAINSGDANLPVPSWNIEKYLAAIYQAIKEKDPADPDVVQQFVEDWLDEHPEATTTVEDGAVTTAKIDDAAVTRAKVADAALADIAAEYSSSATYAVGDYVFHSGALYRCVSAITTAEAWTAAHWTAAVLGDDVADLKSASNYSETTFGIGLTQGKYINGSGVEIIGAGRWVSEYIPCPPNVPVTYVGENNHSNIYGLSFYDKNLVCIGGDKNNGQPKGTPTTVKSPANTCYCRLSTDDALVSAGTYYVKVDGQNQPFVCVNKRINEIENELNADRKISIVEKPFEYPTLFGMTPQVNVYTDGHNYATDFNAEKFMNVGGNTLYVAPLATASGNGTRSNPYRYADAYNNAQDGDTIVLLPGIYTRAGQYFTEIKKSINVIGEDGAVICLGDLTAFSLASGYNNVYVGQRSGGTYVFDVTEVPNRVVPLVAVASIAECAANVGSYYKDSSYYYVHPFADGNPTGKLLISVANSAEIPLSVSNADKSIKVYISNITVIAAPYGTMVNMPSAENTLNVCYDKVKFVYCGYESYNAFTAYGGNIVLHKCEIDGSYRDGFNYNGSSVGGAEPRPCNAMEIDCKASNCGIGQTQETMNASTSHLGTKIVRINGEYHDALGPVVADVQNGTQSVNLGCASYSSTATASGQNNAYQTNKEGAYMWLYDCIGIGNAIDFNATEGATMLLVNCAYDTKADSVVSTTPVNANTWILRHN